MLTNDERNICRVAAIAASNDDRLLLDIIERLTGEKFEDIILTAAQEKIIDDTVMEVAAKTLKPLGEHKTFDEHKMTVWEAVRALPSGPDKILWSMDQKVCAVKDCPNRPIYGHIICVDHVLDDSAKLYRTRDEIIELSTQIGR